jgi:hypothetical protein
MPRRLLAGVRLEATVHPGAAIGTVLLPDDRQPAFRAVLVKRRGGLLERTDRIDGTSYHSGWIVLPDKRVRGRTTVGGTSLNGSTITGPGIAPTSTSPPTDAQVLFSECQSLAQDLRALRELLQFLQAQKPVHPGSGATDEKLATYFARLSSWQAAVTDTRRKIAVVEARIEATCG